MLEEILKGKSAPLSQTQLGIYLECVRMGEGAYNRHFLYTLDSSIDLERLATAIEQTVSARPSMEVRLVQNDAGEIYQVVPKKNAPDLEPYRQSVVFGVAHMSEAKCQETGAQLF